LEGLCAKNIGDSFNETIDGQPFLLIGSGGLKPANEAIILPDSLLEVWPPEQMSAILDSRSRPAFSRYVSVEHRNRLIKAKYIEQISKAEVLKTIQSSHLPKPESWRHLLKLWVYIAPDMTWYRTPIDRSSLHILPVQGKDVLYAANEVTRLGEKRLLQSEQDWEFLDQYLLVLNQNWPNFLAEGRRMAEVRQEDGAKREVEAALSVFDAIGLKDATDVSEVVEQVAAKFFAPGTHQIADCVRLAQIAAKIGAKVGGSFHLLPRIATCVESIRQFYSTRTEQLSSYFRRLGVPNISCTRTMVNRSHLAHQTNGFSGSHLVERACSASLHYHASKNTCGARVLLKRNCAFAGVGMRRLIPTEQLTSSWKTGILKKITGSIGQISLRRTKNSGGV
jgi:hypothetical protein